MRSKIDCPDGNVNIQSGKQIDPVQLAKFRKYLADWPDDPNARPFGISNANPLCLISGHGGAWPGAFGPIVRRNWFPSKPAPRPGKSGPITRDEFCALANQVRDQGIDLQDVATVVTQMRSARKAQ